MICFGGRHVDEGVVARFGSELIKGFRNVGIKVPAQPPVSSPASVHGDISHIVYEATAKSIEAFGKKPDIIFVLVQDSSIELYRRLKAELDTQAGIASQGKVFEALISTIN
jgi:hypothetical protein